MAITQSAKKALRQNVKRHKLNLARKRTLKSLIKQVRTLSTEKKIEEAKKLLPQIYKSLDKTAKVGTIKKNTASRKKSRLAILLNKASQEAKPQK
ncbi:MAG: 30S ribosomal protein S20 [Candidatus Pacebacteria bacterium]|nr:30S ribosomal protein S20 [Candidatus Paceibacterota bacterium]